MKELAQIQQQMNVPKIQWNNFGKYYYRNAEDILAAFKSLLSNCSLTLNDEIVMVGERYYVKSTATLTNQDGESFSATAYAREDEEQKGMTGSQITGSTCSYARKYALNALFALDDIKDADSTNTYDNTKKTPAPKAAAKPAPAATPSPKSSPTPTPASAPTSAAPAAKPTESSNDLGFATNPTEDLFAKCCDENKSKKTFYEAFSKLKKDFPVFASKDYVAKANEYYKTLND